MKSIFNSVGSNYSFKFVLLSLQSIFNSKKNDLLKLETYLKKEYSNGDNAEVLSLYKGRDAIEASLRVLLEPGDEVITQAFSCYAVEEGITRAGMKPVYTDISNTSTNLTVTNLEKTFQKNPKCKAVLIQHSLGISANSLAIRKWCDDHGLLLIEDLAQGIGGVDESGNNLGLNADAVIFSFGKDKIIDVVSGGAVVFRNVTPEIREKILDLRLKIRRLPFYIVLIDLIYPFITYWIRRTHHLVVGKVLFVVSKKMGLLGSPIKSRTNKMTFINRAYAKLALFKFGKLEKQIIHRKKMAQEYFNCLSNSGLSFLVNINDIKKSSNLRFSVRCKDFKEVGKITKALKENRIYVSDRWYRKAVDCGSFACKTAYKQGSCPNAELLATQVLNLPTHRKMTIKKVQKICKIINQTLGK